MGPGGPPRPPTSDGPPGLPPPPASGPLPAFYPVLQPGRPLHQEVGPGYSPYPPPEPRGAAPPPRRPSAPKRWPRSASSRDIAIGCAIAALVVAAFVSAKFLVFGDEPRAEAEAVPTGTIVVVVRDPQPAEVSVDGKVAGAIRDQAPLTLSSLPPGPHSVRVTRAGAPPCEHDIQLASRQAKVVECSFPKAPSHGRLILAGLEPGHRVFVDDQEVSGEGAREPLNLTPGVEHAIQIKSGTSQVIEEFSVELEPGQEERRDLKSARPGSRDKDRARPARGASRGVSAPRDEPDVDLDEEEVEEEEPRPRTRSALKPTSGAPGSFTAYTQPFARVFIDGKDTGKMTPIAPRSAIPLAPGPHEVTFVVGDQKFNYRINIAPGESKNLIRTLRVE
ncbi:MAG TPA: PEGA domain-containing protein [Kofleriaceae bacterium]|nr:PEGA domain-containing protein [Kofleriaceae bacterium]